MNNLITKFLTLCWKGAKWLRAHFGAILIFVLAGVIVALCSIFIWIVFDQHAAYRFAIRFGIDGLDNSKYEMLKFIGLGIGGVLAAIGAIAINRRADAQVKSAQAQVKNNELVEKGHTQEQFKTATEHLGKPETQIAAYYEFCQLAKNHEDLRKIIFNILCAHLRKETSTDEYKEIAKERPTENIQSLLDILFKPESEFKEIFEEFDVYLPRVHLLNANLSNAHMKNAYFGEANLTQVDFGRTNLQEARFWDTNLRKARFWKANLQHAFFLSKKIQSANFYETNLQYVDFLVSDLQHVNFRNSDLQHVNFRNSDLQHVSFWNSDLQYVNFEKVKLQNAKFDYSNLGNAIFKRANLQGANFSSARNMTDKMIKDSIIDDETQLPEGISHPNR